MMVLPRQIPLSRRFGASRHEHLRPSATLKLLEPEKWRADEWPAGRGQPAAPRIQSRLGHRSSVRFPLPGRRGTQNHTLSIDPAVAMPGHQIYQRGKIVAKWGRLAASFSRPVPHAGRRHHGAMLAGIEVHAQCAAGPSRPASTFVPVSKEGIRGGFPTAVTGHAYSCRRSCGCRAPVLSGHLLCPSSCSMRFAAGGLFKWFHLVAAIGAMLAACAYRYGTGASWGNRSGRSMQNWYG